MERTNKMSRRKKKRLINRSIGIDIEMLEWYEEEADNRDMSVSELMRLALKEFLNREQQVKDFKDKGDTPQPEMDAENTH